MRQLWIVSLILTGLVTCNPYQTYYYTHYHMIAEMDPETGILNANLQMVFFAKKTYADSIVFRLNKGLEVISLSSQGLRYYELDGDGGLVLYIQDTVVPGAQQHISMSYFGNPGFTADPPGSGYLLDSSLYWYPWNEDVQIMTYDYLFEIPGGYQIQSTVPVNQSREGWQLQNPKPGSHAVVHIRKN